jgi:hypothetical protein
MFDFVMGKQLMESSELRLSLISRYKASMVRQLILVVMLLAGLQVASANDIFLSQSGGGSGTSCSSTLPASFFNNSSNWGTAFGQIGPGTTVHLCGTFTGAPGSTLLTFQGSGASGNPITVLFETGAQLNAPYWAANNGAIYMANRSWVTIDGGTNGIIQNTANGDSLTYKQRSDMIVATQCNHCTVKNLDLINSYVHVQGSPNTNIDQTQVRAILMSGSNWLVTNNVLHDCGWCIIDFFGNGDTMVEISKNDFYHMDHGFTWASNAANTVGSYLLFHDNKVHDTFNWDCTNNGCHHDGVHTYTTGGSTNTMHDIYFYNNYFYGNWGNTPTGFIFIEGGTGTPSHMSNSYWWNNVFVVPPGSFVNTNGWVGIFSGDSGTTFFVHNTFIGPNATDNTACFNIGSVNNLVFQNNAVDQCGNGVQLGSLRSTLASSVDYNLYGNMCLNGANCYEFNGKYLGSFSAWKSATGFDSHTTQKSSTGLNADGSLSSASAAITGTNLGGLVTGALSGLQNDTSKGNTRTTTSRLLSWTVGAYNYGGSSTASAPNPPTGLAAVVN